MGTPVIALCGKVWVPSRAPEKFPVCPECKEIWESMKPGERRWQWRPGGSGPDDVTGAARRARCSPAWPDRAAWGTAPSLRAWQTAADRRLLERASRATSWPSRRPGAGKTTFALTVAAELLGRRIVDRIIVVAPTEHLKTQWAEAAARAGIPIDPTYSAGQGQDVRRLRRHRRDLRRRRGQPARDADPHRALQDPGHPRRGAPCRRRAVVGRGCARGVRTGDATARADRHAVPLRHQPDPVRHLRTRRRRHPDARPPTSPTATRTHWPTTSCVRCCSWPTPARCSGAPVPATRSRRGSASRSPRTCTPRRCAPRSTRRVRGSRRCSRPPTSGSPRYAATSPTPAAWSSPATRTPLVPTPRC